MFLDIEYVIAVCECIIHFNEGYPFDKKYIDEGYIENYKDLLEECICLNESVFLKDKSIRIRKVEFDGENVWIGEWEEMNDRMRDGMVGYYRLGVSGQRVLDEIENNKNCGRDWVKIGLWKSQFAGNTRLPIYRLPI